MLDRAPRIQAAPIRRAAQGSIIAAAVPHRAAMADDFQIVASPIAGVIGRSTTNTSTPAIAPIAAHRAPSR